MFFHPSIFHIANHLKIATAYTKGFFPCREKIQEKFSAIDGNYYIWKFVCLPKYKFNFDFPPQEREKLFLG